MRHQENKKVTEIGVARARTGKKFMTPKVPTTEMLKGGHMAITAAVWLTALEAAQYLRVEPRTLLMWARKGKVKGYVLSGTQRVTWRFRAEDLDATMSPPSVALKNGRIQ
jgi:excisionase family DNA binding protein